jgi:hypothetical protein
MRMPAALMTLLLALGDSAFADCECLWGGPFTRVEGNTDLVVAVEVISGKGNSIDLRIEDILRGEEHREEIRLWLDSGEMCRPPADQFTAGSRWVMALDEISELPPGSFNPNTPNISFGRVEDYSLSKCGGYWLELAENLVSGNLVGGARWDMDPKMSPVLLELVKDFVQGRLNADALKEASKVDPELQRLRIDTRSFLRGQQGGLQDFIDANEAATESDAP